MRMNVSTTQEPNFGSDWVLVGKTNEVRERVVHDLAAYIDLSAAMREFENAFQARVMHTAQQLHDAIEERRRLEAEFERIRRKVDRGEYGGAEEVEDDVRAALTPVDADARAEAPEAVGDDDSTGDGVDPAAKKRIIREFKRIVLPKVHADTSDTSYSIFEVAYSAYKSGDHVLMEAFVIQYRGEVDGSDDDGRPLTRSRLETRLSEYRAAARRLDDRCRDLRRDAVEDEIRDPEQVHERIARQQEEFRRAVVREAERVQELRARLEALVEEGSA